MKKTWKRLCTGFLALATVVTALPTTPVHAESKQYWTESAERVGIIEKVSIMLASIIKTISLPKLIVHGLQRQSLKQTATGQLTTSQN